MKRNQDSMTMKNSRSEILRRMNNVLVKEQRKGKLFINLKTSDEIQQYMDNTLKNVEKYRVVDGEYIRPL